MAIKKSELYSSLWQSCDELRGGMDASQYKDYVLVLLFIKYISDRYAGKPYSPIKIPEGASFADMVELKGKTDIGDQINKKIIGPLYKENAKLSQADFPDFNDEAKLGKGKEMADRLTNLIAIFENPALDFSANRADGDDILGDAYEYLMRHFATESGKSKGQFYTPAEVSRVMAQVLGIHDAATEAKTTVYDPTCGSGSLLLKVGEAAGTVVSLYGQEKDQATSGLARMNMVLHNFPSAEIRHGNTITDPKLSESGELKIYDYVVANPPFSDKRWSTGLNPSEDPHGRFKGFGVPPAKQGDYAYLLHIVRSLKTTGKGACILPHGVLFRGHAEAEIRRNLVRRGYIKGIIGLPPNLFYGTGIPACIVVIDKEGAQARKGIFLIDASRGFMKDGPKNRLREQDIHKIVDVFDKQVDVPKYARMVPTAEIEKSEFNLNLPRYIDSQEPEDLQDIAGHLQGGIPVADVDDLERYWGVCPGLRKHLFSENRSGYVDLAVEPSAIQATIYEHPEFAAFVSRMNGHFEAWRKKTSSELKDLEPGFAPKERIADLAEDLLAYYRGLPLIDAYDIYQCLMEYWAETMQDDAYMISAEGWTESVKPRELQKVPNKNGNLVWAEAYDYLQGKRRFKSDLVPGGVLIRRFFVQELATIDDFNAQLEAVEQELQTLLEEHGSEGGLLEDVTEVEGDKLKITAGAIKAWLEENGGNADFGEESAAISNYGELLRRQSSLKKSVRVKTAEMYEAMAEQYTKLTESEIKMLVVDDKWMTALETALQGELDRVSQRLTQRVRELAERYAAPLPQMVDRVADLEAKVDAHLRKMGFSW